MKLTVPGPCVVALYVFDVCGSHEWNRIVFDVDKVFGREPTQIEMERTTDRRQSTHGIVTDSDLGIHREATTVDLAKRLSRRI